MNNALIIMIKNPVLGKVKTRLARDVGDEIALNVYKVLLQHSADVASRIHDVKRFVFYSDVVDRNDMFGNDIFKKYVQCSGDLGTRMDYAFSIPFKDEFRQVVMIGSDCIDITSEHISNAFEKLKDHDFVIGPATDGGYYLIGMKKWNRWIFQNKSWSTDKLLEETKIEIASKNGSLFLLPALSDIDTKNDIKKDSPLYGLIYES